MQHEVSHAGMYLGAHHLISREAWKFGLGELFGEVFFFCFFVFLHSSDA